MWLPTPSLFANLGAVQLNYGYGVDQARRAVELVGADGLILHTNPLHEALQPDGDADFRGLVEKIADLRRRLEQPIVVREVGWGISGRVARDLIGAGVDAIDVAGAGGTSWSAVERFRIEDPNRQRVAESFRSWGTPTADTIHDVRSELPGVPLVARGGLRSGLDCAKALAIGADLCGMVLPFLKATAESDRALEELVSEMRRAADCDVCDWISLGERVAGGLRG